MSSTSTSSIAVIQRLSASTAVVVVVVVVVDDDHDDHDGDAVIVLGIVLGPPSQINGIIVVSRSIHKALDGFVIASAQRFDDPHSRSRRAFQTLIVINRLRIIVIVVRLSSATTGPSQLLLQKLLQ